MPLGSAGSTLSSPVRCHVSVLRVERVVTLTVALASMTGGEAVASEDILAH